jgi:HD superfamily phosphohydrolase
VPKTKQRAPKTPTAPTLFPVRTGDVPPPPPFEDLLRQPLLTAPLPKNFDVVKEAAHLRNLWELSDGFRQYAFNAFVHAGGSGMVFRVFKNNNPSTPLAMKVARKHLFPDTATVGPDMKLSPVSEAELRALEQLSHPNVARLYDAIQVDGNVFAICTTYVEKPSPLDTYLRETLGKKPKGVHPFSLERLDSACVYLIKRCEEVASALQHMHSLKIFHFDIKPANILISGITHQALLTDMGSCVHTDQFTTVGKIRVRYTWTYAHPDLTDIVSDPNSISGEGLKASSQVDPKDNLARFDLFAFGKTIQETLAILAHEFGERCYASYPFRFLHIIACLLLDGHNAPASPSPTPLSTVLKDGRDFVNDVALGYPGDLFVLHKIKSAIELVARLGRYTRQYSWFGDVPELDPWQPEIINSGTVRHAPNTKRLRALFNHECIARLKDEPQLGRILEVYPSATHTRWVHTLGVMSSVASVLSALLSDPEVPTFRILADQVDIETAIVAAVLHDIGQTSFGHDFEAASQIFNHELYTRRLIDDERWGKPTLRKVIELNWRGIDVERVLAVLHVADSDEAKLRPIDGVASDTISGPSDADKLDYLIRDSIVCGVPYGQGMDLERLLRALTVTGIRSESHCRLALAYKAKGRTAVESMLLARYLMYGGVYWHHTFRCIQAMFTHAAISCFGEYSAAHNIEAFRGQSFTLEDVQAAYYHRVICRAPWREYKWSRGRLPKGFFIEPPDLVAREPALEFLWQFIDEDMRGLVLRIAKRDLHKRVFEMTLDELGERADYSAMCAELSGVKRIQKANDLRRNLIAKVDAKMRKRGPRETVSENAARDQLQKIRGDKSPVVVIDFPIRGLPEERHFPKEIGDAYRKYFTLATQKRSDANSIFHVVRERQKLIAAVRVFATNELHELIIRYLDPEDIRACIVEVLPAIRTE